MTIHSSPLIVAKNMAALRTRQAAIAQCGRRIAELNDFEGFDEKTFWREVIDHLDNTNFD